MLPSRKELEHTQSRLQQHAANVHVLNFTQLKSIQSPKPLCTAHDPRPNTSKSSNAPSMARRANARKDGPTNRNLIKPEGNNLSTSQDARYGVNDNVDAG